MKRTVQDVVRNKTLKKLKSLTYGTRTKQFFIEAAALNLPPVKIQQFVRLLHSVYYPQTTRGGQGLGGPLPKVPPGLWVL